MKKEVLVIVIATFLTALIVGYGIYVWNQPAKELPENPIMIFNTES